MAASSAKVSCGRKSKRVKRLKWTRQETVDLISAWKDMSQLFKTFGQRKPFYEEISKKLIRLGHNRSTEQCQTKMNRLKYLYRRFKVGAECDKRLSFCENIEEMLDECYMSGDEDSDDGLEGNNAALCPALYVQAELKLSPERKEQDDNWDVCKRSPDVFSNEEVDSIVEIPNSPTSSRGESDFSSLTQKSKFKSEIWTHNETSTLISEWKKVHDSESSTLKRGVYEELARSLSLYGYDRTAEQCQRKVSSLKLKYKKQHTSNDDPDWPHYKALHEFLGKEATKCATCTRNKIDVEDNWTREETESLISAWKRLNSELENTVIRTPIYEKMSHHLTELGFKRNAEECQQKVIQLKILYRQTSYNSNYFDESWPYYDAVHEIMKEGSSNNKVKLTTEPRMILPKSPLVDITTMLPEEQNAKQDDTSGKHDVEVTNQTVLCLEPVTLLVPQSSAQSSMLGVTKSPNLVLVPQISTESLSTNLISSNIQQTSHSWPSSVFLIPVTNNSTSALQNKGGMISVNIETNS